MCAPCTCVVCSWVLNIVFRNWKSTLSTSDGAISFFLCHCSRQCTDKEAPTPKVSSGNRNTRPVLQCRVCIIVMYSARAAAVARIHG